MPFIADGKNIAAKSETNSYRVSFDAIHLYTCEFARLPPKVANVRFSSHAAESVYFELPGVTLRNWARPLLKLPCGLKYSALL